MKENIRRPLLFLITVGTGTLIIIFDAPIEVIVAGTVLAGFCTLIITGAVKIADLKPSNLRAALRERPKGNEKGESDTVAPKSSLTSMFGTLTASVREAITHVRAPESEKKRTIEEIDAMLDQAIDGSAPPKTAGGAVDPLAALADLDLNSLEDLDLDEATRPGAAFGSDQFSSLSGAEADVVSEILRAHQSEIDDPGIGFAEGSGATAGLSGLPDLSALSAELSELDDLDLDEIEIEIEGEDVDDEEMDVDEPARAQEAPDEPIDHPEEDFDIVSFASGGMVDDDLIVALKSDVKKKRKKYVEDISLLRELQGEKYDARELAAELEEILAMLK